MTRSEFIHRIVAGAAARGPVPLEACIDLAIKLAGEVERSGEAPWDDAGPEIVHTRYQVQVLVDELRPLIREYLGGPGEFDPDIASIIAGRLADHLSASATRYVRLVETPEATP